MKSTLASLVDFSKGHALRACPFFMWARVSRDYIAYIIQDYII